MRVLPFFLATHARTAFTLALVGPNLFHLTSLSPRLQRLLASIIRALPFLATQPRIAVGLALVGTICFHLTRLSLGLQRLVALMMRTLPFLATQARTTFVVALAGAAVNESVTAVVSAARASSRKRVFIFSPNAFE